MEDTKLIKKIIKHNNSIKQLSAVIRLPSMIIENKKLLDNFSENIEILSNSGLKFIIIHDYSNLIEKHLNFLSIDQALYSSQLGNDNIYDLFEMIISGHVNKYIVSRLCAFGLLSIGLSGKDGDLLIAKKSKQRTISANKIYVSEPLVVNPEILFEIEETKIIPVISPVAQNELGKTTILDIDITAAMIASSINANRLIIMCENNFLINEVKVLSTIEELNMLVVNNISITFQDSLIKAARYILLNSDSSVYFVDSQKTDSLLMSIFG